MFLFLDLDLYLYDTATGIFFLFLWKTNIAMMNCSGDGMSIFIHFCFSGIYIYTNFIIIMSDMQK